MSLRTIKDNIETSKIALESDECENVAINKIANGMHQKMYSFKIKI